MQQIPGNSKESINYLVLAFICFLIAVPFAYSSIQYAFSEGKLTQDVNYDDVSYYNYGYQLYAAFTQGGIKGFWNSLMTIQPRSFYCSVAASFSFILFGVTDWAPLASNVVVLTSLLFVSLLLVQRCQWWVQAAVVIYILSSPFAYIAITEFRPDPFAAILMFSSAAYLFLANNYKARKRDFFRSGALLGASFLAKSTIFPLTIVVGIIIFSLGAGIHIWRLIEEKRPKSLVDEILKLALIFGAGVFLVAFLQILASWSYMVDYFKGAVLGKEAGLWNFYGSRYEKMVYYLYGEGTLFIAPHLYLSYALGAVGMLFVIFLGTRTHRLAYGALFVVLLCIYTILSIAEMKTRHIGLPVIIYTLLAPVITVQIIQQYRLRNGFNRRLAMGFLSLVLVYSVFLALPSYAIDTRTWSLGNDGAAQRRINRAILKTITNDFAPESGKKSVFIQSTGFLNFDTLIWLGYRERLPIGKVQGPTGYTTVEQMKNLGKNSDYIIVTDGNVGGAHPWYPSNKLGADLVKVLDQDPEVKRIGAVPSVYGPNYVVYRNKRTESEKLYAGWTHVLGGIVFETPIYIIGCSLNIEFTLRNEPVENAAFRAGVWGKTNKPQTVSVYLDDKKITEFVLKHMNDGGKMVFPLGNIKGGEKVIFRCSAAEQEMTTDGKIIPIAFDEARVIKNPPPAPAPAPAPPTP